MAQQKMRPCCARRRAKLTMDEANLARLAKRASSLHAQGKDYSQFTVLIEQNRALIAEDKRQIDLHDAEHAGDPTS